MSDQNQTLYNQAGEPVTDELPKIARRIPQAHVAVSVDGGYVVKGDGYHLHIDPKHAAALERHIGFAASAFISQVADREQAQRLVHDGIYDLFGEHNETICESQLRALERSSAREEMRFAPRATEDQARAQEYVSTKVYAERVRGPMAGTLGAVVQGNRAPTAEELAAQLVEPAPEPAASEAPVFQEITFRDPPPPPVDVTGTHQDPDWLGDRREG